MKKFYLIATAVTMLTACTNSEKLTADFSNDGPVMIGFETFHEKSLKSAPSPTGEITDPTDFTDGHGGFGVWGFKGKPSVIDEAKDPNASSEDPSADHTKIVNISTDDFTTIFDNVKVWYVDGTETYKPKGFTYKVPKYWDKEAEYIFFAYAPYNDTKSTVETSKDVASLDKETGKITIRDIESIQDLSKSTGTGIDTQFGGTGTGKAYTKADATGAIDYLMAKYETNQKYTATNQDTKDWANYTSNPDLRDQTVGFTFGHMLSRIVVKLLAADQYPGVKTMEVSYLSIKNMPEVKSDLAVFTQNSPIDPAGTYSPATWSGKNLQIINSGTDNTNATATSNLFILKNGVGKNGETTTTNANEMTTITPPTAQPQLFYYYVAPNAPSGDSENKTDHYYLNINYTITYVDNIVENVVLKDIDLGGKLASMLQNNSYTLTIKVGLNQIYFTVDAVTGWTELDGQEIEIK